HRSRQDSAAAAEIDDQPTIPSPAVHRGDENRASSPCHAAEPGVMNVGQIISVSVVHDRKPARMPALRRASEGRWGRHSCLPEPAGKNAGPTIAPGWLVV